MFFSKAARTATSLFSSLQDIITQTYATAPFFAVTRLKSVASSFDVQVDVTFLGFVSYIMKHSS